MLTDTALRKLKPKAPPYKVSDRDGMYVTVSKVGTITFRYDYRLNGRRETRAMRKHIIDRDILPAFKNRLLAEISPDDLRALCMKVKKRGAPATAIITVTLKSHLSIERQSRAIGATWLDQQLIAGGQGMGDQGFGTEARQALQQRADFLAEEGLAERRGRRVILARNLLSTLCNRELAKTAEGITAETGLVYSPTTEGERVSGIYRRSLMLSSGRFAMLDNGMGFSLVSWKPVIEQRLGQSLSAVVRGRSISWEVGRNRGL